MNAPELENAHRHAARAADIVQHLADLLRAIADTVNTGSSSLGDLAVAIESLADQARTAADTIDRCLALASACPDHGTGGLLASARYDLAAQWTVLLKKTLDAAVGIYQCACSELADRVALAEEHLPTLPSADGQRLSAVILARHARALAQSTAGR